MREPGEEGSNQYSFSQLAWLAVDLRKAQGPQRHPQSWELSLRLSRLTCVFLCLILLAFGATSSAATRHVCASGCEYTKLQAAIDAASPGDTILLRAGETFVGPFILKAKPSSTSWITIRSDAADSALPADGVRLIPSGKANANTSRSLLPRL